MAIHQKAPIQIDLDQFKLHLNLPESGVLSLHFDTPSRRFYLSVMALVVEEMKKRGTASSVLLEPHAETLALLNETVGGGKGSSKKKRLLPRIYKKWKGALPDLENAPLFKIMGRKKGYEDETGPVYRFDNKTKDLWANLFEYTGSREKLRLRFAVERLGVEPGDVELVFAGYGGPESAWDQFLSSLQPGSDADIPKDDARKIAPLTPPSEAAPLPETSGNDVGEALKTWLNRQEGIDKIPLKTRLELIARLAGVRDPSKPEGKVYTATPEPSDVDESPSGLETHISKMLMAGISAQGNNPMLYVAPEVLDGRMPSPRSEVYALGVLLYQVVVGDLSRPLDPDWKLSVLDDVLREDIAACVETLPEKRLANPLELTRRLQTLEERRKLLVSRSPLGMQNAHFPGRRKRRWIAWGLATAAVLALLALPAWYYQKVSRAEAAKKTAYETDLPKIRQLLETEEYVAAHALAREAEKIISNDPTLQQYIKDATSSFDIETMPAGARVSYRPYNDLKGPWIDLGVTPIKKAMIPVGMTRFRIQKQGYTERELVRPVLFRDSLSPEYRKLKGISHTLQFNLYPVKRIPDGMLSVDGGRFTVPINALPMSLEKIVLDRFFIDKTEVTNRAYKEFLDAGGYRNPQYWQQEFKKDGRVIPWGEAMKIFVDCTGRPGPSTWELGNYPDGQDEYPVSGVSWYEAAAYAEFKRKTLPTIYHWCRAAFPTNERITPLTALIIPQSNIEGTGIAESGRFPGTGSSGAKDMAGNVREWCWNGFEGNRYSLGGMWQDPAYMFNEGIAPSAWNRASGNGFRCALYPEDTLVPNDLLAEVQVGVYYDPYTIPPYSEKAFEALKGMFTYKPTPLNPVVESRKKEGRGWIRETVSIDAAYNKERLIIHLDLPERCKPPYKTLVYFPGGNSFHQTKFSRNFLWEPWDLLPENGRVLVSPIYAGTFERGGGDLGRFVKKSFFQRFYEYLNDLRRTIDYLETRNDIDGKSIVYIGACSGALLGPVFSPYEDRIRGLILVSGGISNPVAHPKPKGLVQPFVTVPVLMLNGKYDYAFPLKTHQKPLFDLIATPPEHKKHVIYDCGHLPLPRAPMMKEIFDWLDKYQGPVDCGGTAKTY